MKKILYVDNFAERLGGGEKHLLSLAKAAQEVFDVTILCKEQSDLAKKAKILNIKTINFDFNQNIFKSIKYLRRILATNEIDIIHSHGFFCNVLSRLAGRLSGTPLIISTVHCENRPINSTVFSRVWYALRRFADKQTAKFSHKIIVVSKKLAQDLIELGIPKSKIVVIPNGISIKEFQQASAQPTEIQIKDKYAIGSIGRLERVKGFDYLIKAFNLINKKIPNVFLFIVGTGSYKEELEKLVHNLKLSNKVIFTGYVDNVAPLLKNFSLYLAPSLAEGFNFTLLEAMALKVPVIASKVGGMPEIIEHNKSGLLVPPANYYKLAEAIEYLLKNPEEKERLSHNAYKTLATKFNLDQMLKKTFSVYSDKLKG